MKSFFNAKKIAIIGASRHKEKVGYAVMHNLLKNPKLIIYPVNPKAHEIQGRHCYPSILDVPNNIDLAIVVVKAKLVPEVMKEIAKKKVKQVIIISAGFSETGETRLENKIKKIAFENKIQVLGPNCLGILSPKHKLNATFYNKIPEQGKIAFITQSGAVGVAMLDKAIKEQIGLSGFVSIGNQSGININDAISYFSKDKDTEVIALYIESLKQDTGKDFIRICKASGKKIIAIKAGQTEPGKKAASSHTAALATDSRIYSGAFKQARITEVDSLEQLFIISELLTKPKYKNLRNKTVIITNAGGLGVLAADACHKNEIHVTSLPIKISNKLSSILPKTSARQDPLDIIGDAQANRYKSVLTLLDKQSFFDFFIVLLTPQQMTQPLETAILLTHLKKPVFASFIGGKQVDKANKLFKHYKIPHFDDVYDLAKVVGKIIKN